MDSVTVREWLKDEVKLRNFLQAMSEISLLERKKKRVGDEEEIGKTMFLWLWKKEPLELFYLDLSSELKLLN